MKTKLVLLAFLLLIFSLFGCTNTHEVPVSTNVNSTTNSIAKEILNTDVNADFFQWGDVIYQTEVEWIDELLLQEGEQIGVIEFEASETKDFKNGTANKLPIGAKIYSVKENHSILVVKYVHQTKRYLALLEG